MTAYTAINVDWNV